MIELKIDKLKIFCKYGPWTLLCFRQCLDDFNARNNAYVAVASAMWVTAIQSEEKSTNVT